MSSAPTKGIVNLECDGGHIGGTLIESIYDGSLLLHQMNPQVQRPPPSLFGRYDASGDRLFVTAEGSVLAIQNLTAAIEPAAATASSSVAAAAPRAHPIELLLVSSLSVAALCLSVAMAALAVGRSVRAGRHDLCVGEVGEVDFEHRRGWPWSIRRDAVPTFLRTFWA